jgi:hypothetical protein
VFYHFPLARQNEVPIHSIPLKFLTNNNPVRIVSLGRLESRQNKYNQCRRLIIQQKKLITASQCPKILNRTSRRANIGNLSQRYYQDYVKRSTSFGVGSKLRRFGIHPGKTSIPTTGMPG